MRPKFIFYLVVMMSVLPGLAFAGAVNEKDFMVETTQDLFNLCTADTDDPFYYQAINFCHGYMQGAYDYYEAAFSAGAGPQMVCFSNPPPTRNDAVGMFIEWAKTNPQYGQKRPVDTFFRFLAEKFPCK